MTVHFETLRKKDIHSAFACVGKVFLNHEPLTSHLGVDAADFKQFTTDLITHAVSQNLSFVARDASSGEVVGVRVVTDLSDDFMPREDYGAKMALILHFLAYVSQPAHSFTQDLRKRTIHVHMSAVDPDFHRLGIAKELLIRSSKHALVAGYHSCLGEVTNTYNRSMLSRIPSYRALVMIRYEDYEVDGKRPFSMMRDHDGCALYRFDLKDVDKRVYDRAI